jgi:hypothetical protein
MLGCAGKGSTPRRSFAARFAALRAHQGPLLVAHVAQTLTQRLKVVEPAVVNSGMMAAQDDLMLVVTEDAALELAGYGHDSPLEIGDHSELPD